MTNEGNNYFLIVHSVFSVFDFLVGTQNIKLKMKNDERRQQLPLNFSFSVQCFSFFRIQFCSINTFQEDCYQFFAFLYTEIEI